MHTDETKAKRVLIGLQSKLTADKLRMLFVAFLSESDETITGVFYVITEIFKNNPSIFFHYGDKKVMEFTQAVKKVEREKHRMKSFIRFQKSNDGMFFCTVKPDFNVLPLIVKFFKDRYADQKWFIYDEKRKYGILYDTKIVQEVTRVDIQTLTVSTEITTVDIDDEEQKYAELWKTYFKSTNIESRKNMKLHLQHVPRRYWRYLTEKL